MTKKQIVIIVLIVIVGLFLYYIIKDNDEGKSIELDTTTKVRLECAESDTQLTNRWTELSQLIQLAIENNVNPTALTRTAVRAGRNGIVATRHWLKACESYIPEAAESYRQLLMDIDPKLDKLEGK